MWESRTERRAREGFRLEAAFFAADRLMGMMSLLTEHFYDKDTENAVNGIEWTQRKEGLQPIFEMKS